MPYPVKTNPDAILEAALGLLEQDSSFSMRSLAEKLEITPAALYRYYPDRKALEVALAWRSLEMLGDHLESRSQNLPPERALEALVRAYLEFVEARPALYQLMTNTPELQNKPKSQTSPKLWTLTERVVAAISPEADAQGVVSAAWSLVHGYVSLRRNGLLPEGERLDTGLRLLISGLRAARP